MRDEYSLTPSDRAKEMVAALLGDGELRAPDPHKPWLPGKPYFHHFCSMDAVEAEMEYQRLLRLPAHKRQRDLLSCMERDGRLEAG